MTPLMALVDANAFYCNCEVLFKPQYRDFPIVVLSNNDGCVISGNRKAKSFGITIGEPYFKIKNLIEKNKIKVFSSNFSLYTNISRRLMMALEELTPRLQKYSVDEAFLDLSFLENKKEQDILQYGHFIKKRIERHVGIPVSVGIAPTKALTKVANYLAKKSPRSFGVVTLTNSKWQDRALEKTPVEKLWGVGRRSASKLHAMGIHTAKELRDYKREDRIQRIFTKTGLQVKHELQGIPCFSLETTRDKKKGIMTSRTFGIPVFDLPSLNFAVANYMTLAAEKLRKQDSFCSEVSIFFRTNPHDKTVSQTYVYDSEKLLTPTLDTRKLIEVATRLVEKNFHPGYEYKKAGVALSDFHDKGQVQIHLFSTGDDQKTENLMEMMDKINQKEGPFTLKSLACGTDNHPWNMTRNFKSPRYTSSWAEIPVAKCHHDICLN